LRHAFSGQTVLVTGHTGFKGSWLCEWLILLGANVVGFSLPPPGAPNLFAELGLADRLGHRLGDIRDREAVTGVVLEVAPAFVFHLAAQSLVRASYEEPVETYATNVLGTVNLLDAVRGAGKPCVVTCITSDKCYENREWDYAYRECDPMGGFDPYSSSKAAAELVIAAYRCSYFGNDGGICLASARAGNVVGGGDWSRDRIVPDCMRALRRNEPVPVRNPKSTRPWQHVLEPLGGYLILAAKIAQAAADRDTARLSDLCSAFNFGPGLAANRSVEELVSEILKHQAGAWKDASEPGAAHEAGRLNLAIDKAFHLLRWHPVWNFERTIAETVHWYQRASKIGVAEFTRGQIESYSADLAIVG
jgi:CDP-glucose 4,6-dehydratase